MKKIIKALVVSAMLTSSSSALAAEHRDISPVAIHADPFRPCVFFYVSGVGRPDPQVPNAETIALPRAHPAFAELFAIVLTARAANLKISVWTTGQSACGQAEVNHISL